MNILSHRSQPICFSRDLNNHMNMKAKKYDSVLKSDEC